MLYVIAIVVLALILGPVLWMKPSATQALQTRLRLRARALGLDVRLCNLPQSRRARVRLEPPRQGVVYRLPVFDPRSVLALEYRIVREDSAAPWEPEQTIALPPTVQASLDRVAAAMPAAVAAIELAPQGPAVYWQERGDEQTVTALAQQLQSLRDAMAVA
jgi:hypothetical protein